MDSVLALLDDTPSQSHGCLMTIESVCRIDKDMHGKVEIATAAIPE